MKKTSFGCYSSCYLCQNRCFNSRQVAFCNIYPNPKVRFSHKVLNLVLLLSLGFFFFGKGLFMLKAMFSNFKSKNDTNALETLGKSIESN